MTRCNNVKVGQASKYLAKDNYYTNEIGFWHGKGAQALGLSGEVAHKDFEALEHGFDLVMGQKLVSIKERSGTDMTFSAPKSVSIAYETGDEKIRDAILAAHQGAVLQTLDEVETYAQMREQKLLSREVKETGNLVISMHTHDTNRELEPQLHTHAFVFNMTQDEKGKWRTLHNDLIHKNIYYFDQIYQNELAKNLKDIGFQIEAEKVKAAVNYSVAIKGIDNQVIDAFSKRTQQVKDALPALKEQYPNASQKELLDMAALSSRKSKIKEIDREAVRAENQALAKQHGVTPEYIESLSKSIHPSAKNLTAGDALKLATIAKTENEALFTREDLTRDALQIGMQSGLTLADIKAELQNNKEILRTEEKDKAGRDYYTTREMQVSEKAFIQAALRGSKTQQAILSDAKGKLDAYISKLNTNLPPEKEINLTKGQAAACQLILENKDRICLIQGDAGTGKTFMVKTAKETALQNGAKVEFVGLAPTGKAAAGLADESGIQAQTVDSFLLKEPTPSADKQRVYIVDEAGMIGTRKMEALLSRAEAEGARVVLIGDRNQFKAVEAGDGFGKLQDAGLATAKMEEVMRQREGTDIKAAVTAFKQGDTDKALRHLAPHTKEGEFGKLETDIVADYLKAPESSLVIASTNAQAAQINEAVRDELVKSGQIEEGRSFELLQSVNITGASKHIASSYEIGQVIEFQKTTGFKGGEKLEIKAIDKDANRLLFEGGRALGLGQSFQASIYQKTEAKFAVGDKVVFNKGDKESGAKNGEMAFIRSVEGSKLTLDKGGKQITVDASKYKHFAHGYCVTDYKAQGATIDKIIIMANAAQASKNALYVQLTRARLQAKLYTDNLAKLSERIKIDQTKTSALGQQAFEVLKAKFVELQQNLQRTHYENARKYTNEPSRWTGYLASARGTVRNTADKLKNAFEHYRDTWRAKSETVLERSANLQHSKDSKLGASYETTAGAAATAAAHRGRDETIQRAHEQARQHTREPEHHSIEPNREITQNQNQNEFIMER